MRKDLRDGLKLRLGCEVAREIERTPVIAPGVSDAAVKAVNSVLYQRLQDQIVDEILLSDFVLGNFGCFYDLPSSCTTKL